MPSLSFCVSLRPILYSQTKEILPYKKPNTKIKKNTPL